MTKQQSQWKPWHKIVIALSVVVLILAGVLAATADAKTRTCTYGTYTEGNEAGMVVGKLRAINLPKKTSSYAPPCLVAETVAYEVSTRTSDDGGKLPKTVHPFGARWDAGRYRCTYEERQGEYNPYMVASCTSRNQKSRRVTFEMGS